MTIRVTIEVSEDTAMFIRSVLDDEADDIMDASYGDDCSDRLAAKLYGVAGHINEAIKASRLIAQCPLDNLSPE